MRKVAPVVPPPPAGVDSPAAADAAGATDSEPDQAEAASPAVDALPVVLWVVAGALLVVVAARATARVPRR